ncbi:sensor histidine kinase [Amorphoplanes digitatis]|uniref:Signal transduction histidine kinase n=1 Tax=Actinoplanes digitatis TaxID=1868 RepID=A0A7W7HWH0_9ACTN|nr:ATP-binding protein [Actinoplanes digitatis]MBB4762003.1 signal transduction histidine kinase [Actinoplanes digitatis]
MAVSLDVGTDRAEHGVHPLHSLRAATALFEAALPPLLTHFTGTTVASPSAAGDVAITLHRAIMVRVTVGSLSYVGFLLEQVYTSHLEERRRIARDLHDRVAHAIGVGLQHFDLHRIYQERAIEGDTERAAGQLRRVDQSLRDAIEITRGLSDELRLSVGPQGLDHALRGYLDANVPPGVVVEYTARGDSAGVPGVIAEEVYVVLQEAVRNALLHSGTDRLAVALSVSESAVTADVADHGRGFDRRPEDFRRGGMLSMRERVELIGGTMSISDNPSGGTTVRVHVSLPGSGP